MKTIKKRVAYAYPGSHRYRTAFHIALRDHLASNDVNYDYIYANNTDDLNRKDQFFLNWAKSVPIYPINLNGRQLVWQPLIKSLFEHDLLIVQQENRQIVNYLLILLAPLFGKRVAYFGHGRNFQAKSPNSLGEKWKRFWATKVHWWFAYTEETADLLVSYGFRRARITVFNNAIDTAAIAVERAALDAAKVDALRRDLVAGSQNVGIYVGGIYAEKRIAFLLQAATEIRACIPDFHLIVIGAGTDAALISEIGLPWVHYVGPKFGMEKTELVALARVWLMPGLVGLAVLDSFAYETPMVTCNLPYHSPEIAYLEHGINGIIVENADSSAAYADAVADLLTNETKRTKLVQGAVTARDTYTIEAMAQRFADGVIAALE